MKELRRILENPTHIVICGRTRSGKSWTTGKIVEILLEWGKRVVVLDWAGEYECQLLPKFTPIFSFKLLKNDLPEILSEIIRLQSQTAGTWTFDSMSKAIQETNSFSELLNKLRELEEFPVRDSVARAARIRLEMLSKYFTDDEIEFTPSIIDFSVLPITSRKMAVTFYLVQLYNIILRKRLKDVIIVVEEALNIPENLLTQLLTQLAGYKVKCIITSQQYHEGFKQYNLVLHDLGLSRNEVYRHGLPPDIQRLRVGEALLYDVERHKWKKVKVKPPVIVRLQPKWAGGPVEEAEMEVEETKEVEEASEYVKSEHNITEEQYIQSTESEAESLSEGQIDEEKRETPPDPRIDFV